MLKDFFTFHKFRRFCFEFLIYTYSTKLCGTNIPKDFGLQCPTLFGWHCSSLRCCKQSVLLTYSSLRLLYSIYPSQVVNQTWDTQVFSFKIQKDEMLSASLSVGSRTLVLQRGNATRWQLSCWESIYTYSQKKHTWNLFSVWKIVKSGIIFNSKIRYWNSVVFIWILIQLSILYIK